MGGKDSLPISPRGYKYILTMIDCFTRCAVAIPLTNQFTAVAISAIIANFITVNSIIVYYPKTDLHRPR